MLAESLQDIILKLCVVSVITTLLGFLLPTGNSRKSGKKALALIMLCCIAETVAAFVK